MAGFNRRRFLLGTGVTAAGALLGVGTTSPAQAERLLRQVQQRSVSTAGTTLEQVATPVGASGYRRLAAGPGWPLVVRSDLATPQAGRDDRRTALTSFVQFTDLHIVDAQSPARFEYLHPWIGAGCFRPHETLSARGAATLVRRVNSVADGPFTGRKFDFLMSTGDNTDNHEDVELDWFLGLLNGGAITPNTGDPGDYQGVQNSGNTSYYNPGATLADEYKQAGFPYLPGLLPAAITPFTAPGLDIPWYATFGNHDDSVVGTVPDGIPFIDDLYTGSIKIEGFDAATTAALAKAWGTASLLGDIPALLTDASGVVTTVTPDARRKPYTTASFVQAHLDPANTGPGPAGHGFTADNADGKDVYYTFRIAPGITGISLDTTTLGGFSDGSIGLGQYDWVQSTLQAGSSRYYDFLGFEQKQQVTDELFILFSHHTSATMTDTLPDSRHPLELRLNGGAFVSMLQRFPNVLAWVNGHTHANGITAHRSTNHPDCAFWEINTASHVDFPQHARIIEVADNADGTLSLFTTLIEADSPYAADYDDSSLNGLASLYRELAFNDIHANAALLGAATDHNTELLINNPLS